MKINLRILAQREAYRPLLETGEFTEDELQAAVFELDAASPRLPVFLEATKRLSGTWFNPWMVFTRKELDQVDYFQLECRKTVGESPPDMEWNERHIESLQPIPAPAGADICLPERIAVSKARALKPNMVGCVGQVMPEFVVHDEVGAAFAAAGFSGFSLLPVYNSKSQSPHTGVCQLYSKSIMPPAVLDRTTPPGDCGTLRQLGCLVYERLDAGVLHDFNRTAEGWAAGYLPLWVVSARVRTLFLCNNFKGWAFRPVLVKGSEMHAEYQRLWDELFAKVAINPGNFF